MRNILAAIISIYLLMPAAGLSQISDRRDPGIPLNYQSMENFNVRGPKQTTYFLRLPGASPDYRLGSGDVVKIHVVGNEMLTQTLKISNSGNINFILIGNIQAEGLTAEELESEISALLKNRKLIKNSEVLVYIESYEAKPIYVVGEVDNPGEYVMSQQLTLMDAIFLAGGLDYSAARYGFLHRRIKKGGAIPGSNLVGQTEEKPVFNVLMDRTTPQKRILENPEIPAPGTEITKIDLEPIKSGGVLEPNILMEAGDVFVVPRRNIQYFYVVGDVVAPGAHEIKTGKSMLASQAISFAGGATKTAKMSKGILVRYDNGERQEKKVDYAAILKGDHPDFEVLPEDVIFIPGSNAKTLGYALLGIIPFSVQRNISDR